MLEAKKTQSFLAVLQKSFPGIPVIDSKQGVSGTWGVEDACNDYASWVSDEFEVHVLQTFRQAGTGALFPAPDPVAVCLGLPCLPLSLVSGNLAV